MIPTPKLRWAQRKDPHVEFGIRAVLQQWWEDKNMRLAVMKYDKYGIPIPCYQGEWRDVPVEIEHG